MQPRQGLKRTLGPARATRAGHAVHLDAECLEILHAAQIRVPVTGRSREKTRDSAFWPVFRESEADGAFQTSDRKGREGRVSGNGGLPAHPTAWTGSGRHQWLWR